MQKGLLMMVLMGAFCLPPLFAAPDAETEEKLQDEKLVEENEKRDPEMPEDTKPQDEQDSEALAKKEKEEKHQKWLDSLNRLPEDVKNKLTEFYDKYGVEVHVDTDLPVKPQLLQALDDFFVSKSDTPEAQQALKDWLQNGIHIRDNSSCVDCRRASGFSYPILDEGSRAGEEPFSFSVCEDKYTNRDSYSSGGSGSYSGEKIADEAPRDVGDYREILEHEFAHTITPNFKPVDARPIGLGNYDASREGREWAELSKKLASDYPDMDYNSIRGWDGARTNDLLDRGYMRKYSLKNPSEDFATFAQDAWSDPQMMSLMRNDFPAVEQKFQRFKQIYSSRGFTVPDTKIQDLKRLGVPLKS